MAWKRGIQNNQAGIIRKGHIKEYLEPSSKSSGITGKLHVMELEKSSLFDGFGLESHAYVCTPDHGLPPQFREHIYDNILLLHTHEHARVILSAVVHPLVPNNTILLNDIQRLNNKACSGEHMDFTVYQMETFAYDAREGVIGNTALRVINVPTLTEVVISLRVQDASGTPVTLRRSAVVSSILHSVYNHFISRDELFRIKYDCDGVELLIICRVNELYAEDEDDCVMPDIYRGQLDANTSISLESENPSLLVLSPPSDKKVSNCNHDVVQIITSDDEIFPVKRKLLRPCIALTHVVQAGRGKYSEDAAKDNLSATISVDIDACTFDRILLYLEHEARGMEFHFDPLLAPLLLPPAQQLKISGLQECCEKVLGSFQERVRRVYIRFDEIVRRNAEGGAVAGKRGDTLLVMQGMVFDITRWLDEHPGGSTIIPEQALNLDCTIFFEIYHASRQSFLYLKEFYIGELAPEDYGLVPKSDVQPSDAFIEQLGRHCSWRLSPKDMKEVLHKSF